MEMVTGAGALPGGVRLSWAAATDIGLRRADNQDSYLAAPPFFLVADGMGGHAGGKQASATLLGALEPFRGRTLSEAKFRRLLATACREVMDLADANLDYSLSPPGTTLTGLVLVGTGLLPVHEAPSGDSGTDSESESLTDTGVAPHEPAANEPPPGLLVLNVGDSRTYLLENGMLTQLTRDHSQVAQMLEAGMITRDMVRFMPNRSVITRAIGAGQTVLPEIDTWRLPLAGGEARRFLVCSDGLHSMVHEGLIGRALADATTPEVAVKSLVEAALSAGGLDNVTVLVLDIVPGGAPDSGGEPAAESARTGAVPPECVSAGGASVRDEESRDTADTSLFGVAPHENETTEGAGK